MATAFDTLAAAQRMEDAGLDRKHAAAIATTAREAADSAAEAATANRTQLATKADLYRALWLQAAGIVGAITALASIAVALASLLGKASQ